MKDYIPFLSDHAIKQAKKRVWNKLQSKLPDRDLSPFSGLLSQLRNSVSTSTRLEKVILKERMLDNLPERNKVSFFMNRRIWAGITLSVFVGFFITPVFSLSVPSALAVNVLKVVQGEVLVNGIVVQDTALIQEGDDIITGKAAMAHIQLSDDTRLTLAPSTEVRLESTKSALRIYQEYGRVWTQVVNPVDRKGAMEIYFDSGSVLANQKSSFDIRINDDEIEVQVAENLIAVSLTKNALYEGTLGQGARLILNDDLQVEAIPESVEKDIWWAFNESYGSKYISDLNDNYRKDRLSGIAILPDNPLYFLKAWREDIQEALTISDEAKKEVLAQHMELRLNEAQMLIEQGKTQEATQALTAYREAVERSLEVSGPEILEDHVEEVKKELLAKIDMDAGSKLLEDQIEQTSELAAGSLSEKNEIRMLSASQKLSRVPSLLEAQDYEQALYYLKAYQKESLSILEQLEEVPIEEREGLVSDLLEQKLQDLQMLRIIAVIPEFKALNDVSIDSQIVQEMSMMVLSLRERALQRLSEFFVNTDYDLETQYALYAKLKDETSLKPEIVQQFNAMEDALEDAANEEVVVDIEVMDSRFITQDDE